MTKINISHSDQKPTGQVLDLSYKKVKPRPRQSRHWSKSYRYGLIAFMACFIVFLAYHFYLHDKWQELNYRWGMDNLSKGNFDQAAKNFEKVADGKNETDAIYELAVSKYNKKDFEGAISDYQKVLEKDPQNAPAYNGLGNIYRDQRNYSQAEVNYKMAISVSGSYVAAYANWAIMLMDNNKIDEAKKVIAEGLEKNSTSVELNNIKKVLEE